jgi:hypothetical protein
MAIGYGLDDRGVGVRVLVKSRVLSSRQGPPSLLFNVSRELFPREKSCRVVKLTIHFATNVEDGGSARRKAATYTKKRTNTDIHALSGIQTQEPSI